MDSIELAGTSSAAVATGIPTGAYMLRRLGPNHVEDIVSAEFGSASAVPEGGSLGLVSAGFLALAGASPSKTREIGHYVAVVPLHEAEFAKKSPAKKNLKQKKAPKGQSRCSDGHWRMIDDRPVYICD